MTRKLPKKKTITETMSQASDGNPKQPKVIAYGQDTGYQLYGYKDHQIPSKMRVPYILTSYRFPGMTADQCFGSMFQPHNELFNVWSHLIALVVFVAQVAPIVRTVNIIEEPLIVPLLCCALGICIMLVASIYTHLFNSMSPYMYHICFFFDYAAISACFFIISQGMYFYSRPLNTTFSFFNTPEIFLYMNLFNSLICTFMCCSVLIKRPWYHIMVRASAYLSLALFTIFPLVSRLVLCHLIPTNTCPSGSLTHFKQCGFYFVISGLIYATRTPERFAPRLFDVIGQSHNIFHVLSALGTSHLFTALYTDMRERQEALLVDPLLFTELSMLFTTLALVGNLSIVVWMAKSLYSRQTAKKN